MIETIITCDSCGARHKDNKRIYVHLNRVMDASGNGYETESTLVDLCPNCMAMELGVFLGSKKTDVLTGEEWVERVFNRGRMVRNGGAALDDVIPKHS